MLKLLIISSLILHAYFRLTVEIKDQHEVESIIQKVHEYPKETTIGIFAAGKIPYYCPEYRFIDFLGKSDRRVAKSEKKDGKPGHNKWDYGYSIGELKPDLIILPNGISIYDEIMDGQKIGHWYLQKKDYDWAFLPNLWNDSNFKQYEQKSKLIYQRKWKQF